MDRFCEKCKSPLAEGSLFCFACGTRVAVQDAPKVKNNDPEKEIIVTSATDTFDQVDPHILVQPSVEAVVSSEDEVSIAEQNVSKKSKPSLKKVICLVVAATVLLGAVVIGAVSGFDYLIDKSDINDEISDYVDAVYLCEYEKGENIFPAYIADYENTLAAIEALKRTNGPEKIANTRSKNMDNYFGDEIIVSCEVTEFDHINKDASLILLDSINRYDSSQSLKCDDVYRVVFEVNVSGSEKEETYVNYAYALHYEDDWFLYGINKGIYYMDVITSSTQLDKDISSYDKGILY